LDSAGVAPIVSCMSPPRKPQFLIRSMGITGRYSVLILHPSGVEDQKFGFNHKHEAEDWIANEAERWLEDKR
jgi:hypothetical protein